MIKVSVITPIYKTEKFLNKCLDCLTKQTLNDIELIWIDNGASDECREIIKKYAQRLPHIKVIHLENNVGYGGAMNVGLTHATGEYVGFCDSDDWVDEDFFEKLYQATNNGEFDIAYTEYKQEFTDKTIISSHCTNLKIAHSCEGKLSVLKDGAIWDKIFRNQLIKSNNISFLVNSKSYYEDNVLLIQAVYYANAISLISGSYYHYLQRENSTIHNVLEKQVRENYKIDVIAHILNFTIKNDFSEKSKLACLKFLIRSLSLLGIIKAKNDFTLLMSKVEEDPCIYSFMAQMYSAHHPKFFGKIFSVSTDFQRRYLWILGIKIKLQKLKENNL